MGLLGSLLASGEGIEVPTARGLLLVTVLSFINLAYIWANTRGSQLIASSLAAFLQSTDIIWAYFLEVLFFGQQLSLLTVGGVVCVVFAIGLLAMEKLFGVTSNQPGNGTVRVLDACGS